MVFTDINQPLLWGEAENIALLFWKLFKALVAMAYLPAVASMHAPSVQAQNSFPRDISYG